MFFKNLLNFFLNYYQIVKQFEPDQAPTICRASKTSGLIWVKTVCKGYHQMALAANELIASLNYQKPETYYINMNLVCFIVQPNGSI